MIVPTVRFRNEFEGLRHVQNYAVVITLEDPNKIANIYDAITKERRLIRKPVESEEKAKTYKQEILVASQ
jgi:hypothetical protein